MADTASGTAQEMMRETRQRASNVVEGAKQNPIPALMIGAGVAWLLMERSRKKDDGYTRRMDWSDNLRASERGYEGGDYYQAIAEPDYGDLDDRGPRAGRSAGTSRPLDAANDARDTARRAVRRTQNRLQQLLREHPLLVGAAAGLAGVAVGASLPKTGRENELLGEALDAGVDRAQETAREAAATVRDKASAVRDVAEEAVEKVKDEVTPGRT